MVPRNEVSGVDIDTTVEDLQKAFTATGFSKLVVFKGDMDHIVGYVHAKDLFDRPDSLTSILLPTFVVPEPMPGDELLRQFLKRRRHLAVVVDEFGGTAGILTMEDIVEELPGKSKTNTTTLKRMEHGGGRPLARSCTTRNQGPQ